MANQEDISRTTDEYVKWAKEQLENNRLKLENSASRIIEADSDLILNEPESDAAAEETQKCVCNETAEHSSLPGWMRSAIRNAIIPLIPFIPPEKRSRLKKKYE